MDFTHQGWSASAVAVEAADRLRRAILHRAILDRAITAARFRPGYVAGPTYALEMSFKDWELRVLNQPDASRRVSEIERELRAAAESGEVPNEDLDDK